jgi:hypothetical protein
MPPPYIQVQESAFSVAYFSASDDKGILEKNTAKKAYDIFNQNMEVVKSASA